MPTLSAVLLTFSCQFSPLFVNIPLTRLHQSHIYGSGPHQHCSILLTNNGQRMLPKIWVSPFLVRSIPPEMTIMLKVDNRHPLGGPCGREFSAFVIIAELGRPEVTRRGQPEVTRRENFVSNFCIFWRNDPSQTVTTVRITCSHPAPTFGSHYSRSHLNRFTGVIAKHMKTVFAR